MINSQGEFAVQIKLNENGEARIVAVQYGGAEGFTPEELKLAYLDAAVPEVKHDEPAVQLFQDFRGTATGARTDGKLKESYVTEVFTELPAGYPERESVEEYLYAGDRSKHTAGHS